MVLWLSKWGIICSTKGMLDRLLLVNTVNDNLVKFQIIDDFLSEDKILHALVKEFQVNISWKQTK